MDRLGFVRFAVPGSSVRPGSSGTPSRFVRRPAVAHEVLEDRPAVAVKFAVAVVAVAVKFAVVAVAVAVKFAVVKFAVRWFAETRSKSCA